MPALKYALHPDFVLSRTDGRVAFVDAQALAHLYQLGPDEYIVVDDTRGRLHYAKKMAQAERLNLIRLYPRFDGNYELPR
jgi:sarcosine oxidase gamma subunit